MSTNNGTILVTGAAGFIGFHTCQKLLQMGHAVCGLDNLNSYYSVDLKKARLAELQRQDNFRFEKLGLENESEVQALFGICDFYAFA